jgi:hypothetical protein
MLNKFGNTFIIKLALILWRFRTEAKNLDLGIATRGAGDTMQKGPDE